MHLLKAVIVIALVVLVAAAAKPVEAGETGASHRLTGTVWTGDGMQTGLESVVEAAIAADFVIVGEIHINADHHRIQADVIRAMAESGRAPAVIFEMVPRGLQPVLDAFNEASAPDSGALGEALKWKERGWPDWTMYRPIAEVAAASGSRLVAGDLDRTEIRAIGKGGDPGGLPYPEEVGDKLKAAIKAAHCDMLPDAALPAMVAVQQARDRSMARAMIEADTGGGAILIAGAGHARTDWGAPFLIRRMKPDTTIISIGLVEVATDADFFVDYLAEGEDRLPYDAVIFTARSETTDPCEEMAERLKNP
jgi:uncharacterized iron-regulated protein